MAKQTIAPEDCSTMAEVRAGVDALDGDLVRLLARRFAYMRAAARIKPTRDAVMKRLPAGEGPDAARREHSWFTVDFVGEGGGQTVHTRVSGGDAGHTETTMMLSESALSLALDDDNPDIAGQVTTAQAMGPNLLRRVQAGGLRFEVL